MGLKFVTMTMQELPCAPWDKKENFDLGVKWTCLEYLRTKKGQLERGLKQLYESIPHIYIYI